MKPAISSFWRWPLMSALDKTPSDIGSKKRSIPENQISLTIDRTSELKNQAELMLPEKRKYVTNVIADAHGFVLRNISIAVASVAFIRPFQVGQSPSYLRIST